MWVVLPRRSSAFWASLVWHDAVFKVIGGAIPLILLLGGLMAAYLGYDEVKDKLPFSKSKENQEPSNDARLKEEAERYKQEVERLKTNWTRPRPARKFAVPG